MRLCVSLCVLYIEHIFWRQPVLLGEPSINSKAQQTQRVSGLQVQRLIRPWVALVALGQSACAPLITLAQGLRPRGLAVAASEAQRVGGHLRTALDLELGGVGLEGVAFEGTHCEGAYPAP